MTDDLRIDINRHLGVLGGFNVFDGCYELLA
jgi:hypothetical protein